MILGADSILDALVGALLIGLILIGGWGYTRRRQRVSCCSACDYPTEGLTTSTCPECGACLLGSGTRRANDRVLIRLPIPVMLTCRTMAVAFVLAIGLHQGRRHFPWTYSSAHIVIRSWSHQFETLEVAASGLRPGQAHVWRPRPGSVATIIGPSGTVRLRVLDPLMRIEVLDQNDRSYRTTDGLVESDMRRFMQLSGIDMTADGAEKDLHTAMCFVRNVALGGNVSDDLAPGTWPLLSAVASASDSQVEIPAPWFIALAIVAATALWLLLCHKLLKLNWPKRPTRLVEDNVHNR